jgi:phosphoribosyl-AMP cyclohydrolase
MNMKKSIAGVMAGAMAISAMATVASADQEQIVLSYDLKEYVNLADVSTLTFTTSYSDSTSGYKINVTDGSGDVTFGVKNIKYSWGTAIDNYELVSVALSGTQVSRKDSTGALVSASAPAVTYYSAKALGKQYDTDTSGTMQYLADTENTYCVESTNSTAKVSSDKKEFTINFATKEKAGVGSYVIDTLALDAGTEPVVYKTAAAAKEAAAKETVYTTVDYTNAKQGTLTYTGKTSGNTYKLSDLTANGDGTYTGTIVGTGSAAGDSKTVTYTKKDVNYDQTDLGYVVAYVGSGSEKKYINAPISSNLTAKDLVDSVSDVGLNGQYRTMADAKAAYDKWLEDADAITETVTANDLYAVTYGADQVIAFGKYYLNDTVANFNTALAAEDTTKTLDTAIANLVKDKVLVDNVAKVDAANLYAGTQESAKALADFTTDVTFATDEEPDFNVQVTYPGSAAVAGTTETVEVTEAEDGEYYLIDKDGVRKSQSVATGTYAFGSYQVTYTIKVYGLSWDSINNYKEAETYVSGIEGNATKQSITAANYAQGGTWIATAGVSKSSLTSPMNVITALTALKSSGNSYTNPVAVINDVIANNEEVAFTFTSIPGSVKTSLNTVTGVTYQVYDNTWDGDWSNPAFGQHLYASYSNVDSSIFDSTTYGSYSSAWGTNLFNAGITVNSAYTMQLNDTTAFTWGDNSLTFLWSSITDGKVSNATTFLQSMLLYTPVDWYWDSLDISVGAAISEDIVPGAGIEDDGDVVVDEDTDEAEAEVDVDEDEDLDVDFTDDDDFADDDFSDDDYADDDFDDFDDDDFSDDDFDDDFDADDDVDADADTSADVDAAPVEVASPQTGNAPIALAVIPVALAAAAVVAKKKN